MSKMVYLDIYCRDKNVNVTFKSPQGSETKDFYVRFDT